MSAQQHNIYVRAYTTSIEQKKQRNAGYSDNQPQWPDHVLIFDCETRITADQTLTFGVWQFGELRNNQYISLEEGLFHNDEIPAKELKLLRNFVRANKPDTAEDGCDRLRLYSRSKFITEVFGIAIQAKALIVCFNSGFDLSRLAVDWETATNGGWSLIMSQWRDPNTGKLMPNKFFPRIVIKALNSKTSIIHSTRAPMSEPSEKDNQVKLWPSARFLDVRTLLWALRNKSYSLKTGCEEFKTAHKKIDHKPTGRITLKEIEYARNDVSCTMDLLNAAKREFDLHPIAPSPDKMFSPASVAKSYLEELNILHPSEKVTNANKEYGIFMQSYFGGRAECRIRKWEVPVCLVDYMSQYPTVNELLGNSTVLTAESVTFCDATEEVRRLLEETTLERCFDRKLWPKFKFFAFVSPDGDDILPVRTLYNGTTQNIGINCLGSKEPICFAGPDIIASILLTGKVPHIEKAIRVVPLGKQAGLGSTSLRGMVEIDATKHSLFKHVIEQRNVHESDPALHYWLKILANSGSYGLFVELNANESKDTKLRVFSGEESFDTTSDVVEEPGKWFAPYIGALITAGGRLLLAMLEKCISDAGGTYLFCDTDSAAIVSTEHRQKISMPDGAEPITAISWNEVEKIVQRFETLNPYNRKLVPGSILKVHKLNWDVNKKRRQLYGYSIAAKRYALYTKTDNDIEIVEPKAHGLGYFYPPKDSPTGWKHETPKWIFDAWDWIMRGVLGLKREKPDWFDLPVMMKLTLSTPHHALKNLAKGPLMRPNNFMMLPQLCRFGRPEGVDPNKFTLITPFSTERDQWMHSKCIDIHDPQSRVYELTNEYDGRRAVPKNFFMLLESYQNHPEAKSLGPDGKPCESDTRGLLQRAHIVANWPPVYIGKESDKHWEEGDDLSLLEFKTIEYKRKGYTIATDEELERIAKVPKREFMRRGINQHTLQKICKRKSVRAIKLAACLKVLEAKEVQTR
jgi:hypothetical protein